MRKKVISFLIAGLVAATTVLPVCAEEIDQIPTEIIEESFDEDELVGAEVFFEGQANKSDAVVAIGLNKDLYSTVPANSTYFYKVKTETSSDFWYLIDFDCRSDRLEFMLVTPSEKEIIHTPSRNKGYHDSSYQRLEAGAEYYIGVKNVSTDSPSTFGFKISTIADPEPDSKENAKAIALNDYYAGATCAPRVNALRDFDGDMDWLKVTTTTGGTYTLKTKKTEKNSNRILIFAEDNTQLLDGYTSYYVEDDKAVKLTFNANSTYYIYLLSDMGGNYSFGLFDDAHLNVSGANTKPITQIYTDVRAGSFYIEAVQYMYDHSIMSGYNGKNKFGTGDSIRREDFATILYRAVGSPDVKFQNRFADVKSGYYYSDAVEWCVENGIVTGYTPKKTDKVRKFGTGDPITREQLAAMLYRFALYQGKSTDNKSDIKVFPDYTKVSAFAQGPFAWCVRENIITGKKINGRYYLAPNGQATRAECATMLYRYIVNLSI